MKREAVSDTRKRVTKHLREIDQPLDQVRMPCVCASLCLPRSTHSSAMRARSAHLTQPKQDNFHRFAAGTSSLY